MLMRAALDGENGQIGLAEQQDTPSPSFFYLAAACDYFEEPTRFAAAHDIGLS